MSESTDDQTSDQQTPPLAINDLNAAVQIIDLAANRGAFRGEELSQVGGVRDRLALFLSAHTPAPNEEEEEEETDGQEE